MPLGTIFDKWTLPLSDPEYRTLSLDEYECELRMLLGEALRRCLLLRVGVLPCLAATLRRRRLMKALLGEAL